MMQHVNSHQISNFCCPNYINKLPFFFTLTSLTDNQSGNFSRLEASVLENMKLVVPQCSILLDEHLTWKMVNDFF
jgi:hypothetical protein